MDDLTRVLELALAIVYNDRSSGTLSLSMSAFVLFAIVPSVVIIVYIADKISINFCPFFHNEVKY